MTENMEIDLRALLGDYNIETQSSTIYNALRGDAFRGMSLASNFIPEKLNVTDSCAMRLPTHMALSPKLSLKSSDPSFTRSRMAEDKKKIYDFRSRNAIGDNSSSSFNYKPESNPATGKSVLMGFRKREYDVKPTPSDSQRVPFRSTTLEKYMSRESLKDEEVSRKMKMHKVVKKSNTRSIKRGVDAARQQALPSDPKHLSKLQKTSVWTSLPKATKLGNRQIIVNKIIGSREPRLKIQADLSGSSASQAISGKSTKNRRSIHGRQIILDGNPVLNKPDLSVSVDSSTTNIVPTTARKSFQGPIDTTLDYRTRKNVWIPAFEAENSWNQFSPESKAKKIPVKKRISYAKKMKQSASLQGKEKATSKAVVFNKSGSYEKLNDSFSEKSDSDEEETRQRKLQEERIELKRKSLELLERFKFGEAFKKFIPGVRYNSCDSVVNKLPNARLSDVKIKMRLSQLEESSDRVIGLMPTWTSILVRTTEPTQADQIKKTLSNARFVLDEKIFEAKDMLRKLLSLSVSKEKHLPPTEEMENIKYRSGLVQMNVDSLERMFQTLEKRLQRELEEPPPTIDKYLDK